jgi:thiosulfate/3-mercaptopyruvate sulfurtransferase
MREGLQMKIRHWASAIGLSAILISPTYAFQISQPLVDVDWLKKNKNNVVVIDVRKDTKSFTAKAKKSSTIAGMQGCGAKKGAGRSVAGHIPGANLFSWKKVRAKRKVNGVKLIKLVPTKSEMESLMRDHGINKDSAVVITMKGIKSKDVTFATRLYWQMKYWGHDNVAVLDGGTSAWIAAGNKVSRSKSNPKEGNWVAKGPRTELLALTPEVKKSIKAGVQMVDGRTEDYYLGTTYKKKYVYAAGHIPKAKNFPHELLVTGGKSAKLLKPEQFTSLFKAKNIDPQAETITYCDSGHLSTGHWFVMHELLGNSKAKVYDGSMHEWTKLKNPVTAMKAE